MQVKGWIIVAISWFVCINGVFAQPQAGFTISGLPGGVTAAATQGTPLYICKGTTLLLHYTASEGGGVAIISNAYTYNNGSPSSLPKQLYKYPDQFVTFYKPGPDTIWQVVTDEFNQTATAYQPFVVEVTHPDSVFSYTPAAPEVVCGSSNYTFTARNITNDPSLTYSWSFQASSYANVTSNPAVIQFNNATGISRGRYAATLIVKDRYGCTSTSTQKVLVSQIPDASFSSPTSPVSVFNGQNIFTVCTPVNDTVFKFLNTSTTYPNNRSYVINWGDNNGDSTYTDTTWSQGGGHDTLSYLYQKGFDTLTVTVNGYNGCSSTASYGVFVGSNAGGTIGNPGSTTYLCTGDSVGYSVTGYSGNARGTIYIIKINENPAFTDTLRQENLPKTEPYIYWHTFSKASCGVNDGINPPNQYTLSYSISNPCQPPTTGNVNSVYVSGKPSPAMSVSPTLNICNTTTASLTNTTNWGEIYLTGSVVCKYIPGEQVWQITRLSGSGSFSVTGNPGSLAPVWQGGDNSIKLNFTGTGIYQIALHVRLTAKEAPSAPPCAMGDTTVIDTICVRNPPVAQFTLDKKPTCAPDVLTATQMPDTTVACAGDSVIWIVNPINAGNCTATADGVYIDTGLSAQTAKITFRQPGNFEIVLNVYAKGGGGCIGVYRDTVMINGPPVINNWQRRLAAVCAGDSIRPAANVDSCFTPGPLIYQWTFKGGNPASAFGLTPPYITYSAPSMPGSDTIGFAASNGCGTAEDTALIAVAPKPVLSVVPGKTICSGDNVNTTLLSPDTSIVYYWTGKLLSGDATGITSKSGPVINDVLTCTNTSVVEYDVTGTFINGMCISDTVKIMDTILPVVRAYAGPDQFLCQGTDSSQMQATPPVTGTGTWSQVGAPAAIIRNLNNPSTEVTGLQSNNVYTFVWTISNTGSRCVDSTDTVKIILDTIVNIIDQPLPSCPNDSVTIRGHLPSGPDSLSYTYQWLQSNDSINYSPVPPAAGISNGRDITVAAPSSRFYRRMVYFHSCADTSNAVTIIVKTAIPVPSFTPNDSAGCGPLYLLFTNTTTPAPVVQGQFIYKWFVDNTPVSQSPDSASHIFSSPAGGFGDTIYHVILNATNGCATVADTSLITARGMPIASFTPDNASGCSPLTVTFANNSIGSNITNTWNFGNGTADTVINNRIVTHTFHVQFHTDFNVTLQANNGCAISRDSTVISVNPSGIDLHFGASALLNFDCTGDTVLFNNNTIGANLFRWNFGDTTSNSNNTLITTNGSGSVYHVYTIPGVDTVRLCASNGCTQDTCTSMLINVKQRPKAMFSVMPDTVCTGSFVTITNLTQPQDSAFS